MGIVCRACKSWTKLCKQRDFQQQQRWLMTKLPLYYLFFLFKLYFTSVNNSKSYFKNKINYLHRYFCVVASFVICFLKQIIFFILKYHITSKISPKRSLIYKSCAKIISRFIKNFSPKFFTRFYLASLSAMQSYPNLCNVI